MGFKTDRQPTTRPLKGLSRHSITAGYSLVIYSWKRRRGGVLSECFSVSLFLSCGRRREAVVVILNTSSYELVM